MVKLKHIVPLVTKLSTNKVTMDKKAFDDLIKHVNNLTDTVNTLIKHQEASEKAIIAIGKTIE